MRTRVFEQRGRAADPHCPRVHEPLAPPARADQDTVVFFRLGCFRGRREGRHGWSFISKHRSTQPAPRTSSRPASRDRRGPGDGVAAQARRGGSGDGALYEDARRLSGMLTNWRKTIPRGGTGLLSQIRAQRPGIMERPNRGGTSRRAARTIRMNIRLPFEPAPQPLLSRLRST